MKQPERIFTSKQAIREKVPLLIGLVGASGSGKTKSALRLADGIGGRVFFLDSEARRALWYADQHKFQHVEFKAPFGPLDYLAAIEYCAKEGAETIIVDSMSHEWEGPGGVLEMHETEQERLAAAWRCSRDKANMSAWQLPKSQEKRMLNTILQMSVNFIFCFRAKEKINLSGDKPKPMGWMPISSESMIYEMSLNCLLMPNSGGVPSWHPSEMGEKAIIKLPEQFKPIFAKEQPLSEDIGRQLAEWAQGKAEKTMTAMPDIPVHRSSAPAMAIRDSVEQTASFIIATLAKVGTGGVKINTTDGKIFSSPYFDEFVDFAKANKGRVITVHHIDGQIERWESETKDA